MTKNAYKLNFVAKPLFAPFRHRFHIEFGIKYHAFCTFSHSSSMFRGLMSPNFTIFHSFSIGLQFKGSNNGTWFPESKTSIYPVFESLCRVLEIQFSVLRISNTNFSITTYLLLYYIYFRLIGAKALILLFTFSSAVQLICAETKAIRLFRYRFCQHWIFMGQPSENIIFYKATCNSSRRNFYTQFSFDSYRGLEKIAFW